MRFRCRVHPVACGCIGGGRGRTDAGTVHRGAHRPGFLHESDADRCGAGTGRRLAGGEDAGDRRDHEPVCSGAVALGPLVGGSQAGGGDRHILFWCVTGCAIMSFLLVVLTFEDVPPALLPSWSPAPGSL
jgi:hypothetical protein